MQTRILVLYYSSYGHIETMAREVARGAADVRGTVVTVKRVPELVPDEVARQAGMRVEPGLSVMDEVSGGTPYGASTIAGADGRRVPSEKELALAPCQGRHVAELARRLNEGNGIRVDTALAA